MRLHRAPLVVAPVVVLLLAACRSERAAPDSVVEPGTEPTVAAAESGEHVGKAGCVGCLKRPENVVTATGYRFDVELWELPLEHAEALYRPTDAVSSSLSLLVDERGLEKPLRELAARDERVQVVERPELAVRAGTRALLPARTGGGERRWSDGLRLELGGSPTPGWAPNALDFACSWTSPQGEALGRARGVTPLPPGHTMVLWCLPARTLAEQPEPRTARALVALVRITPTS